MRKWIRNKEALEHAPPTAKLVHRVRTASSPSIPELVDESSETESVASSPPPSAKRQRTSATARSRSQGAAPRRAAISAAAASPATIVNDPLYAAAPLAEVGSIEEMRAARELLSLMSYCSSDESDEVS